MMKTPKLRLNLREGIPDDMRGNDSEVETEIHLDNSKRLLAIALNFPN